MEGEVPAVTLRAIWSLIVEAASRWNEVAAPRLGAALAFYTMLSLAPLLITCVAIAGLAFGREAAQGQILAQVQNLAGYPGSRAVQSLLANASHVAPGVAAMAAGIFLALFGASSVFCELRDSLNLVWGVNNSSATGIMGVIRYRFVSFLMILGVGLLLLASLLFSAGAAAAGKLMGGYLPAPEGLLQIADFVLSFLGVTVLFALLYKIVPEVRIGWQDVWIGAAVTAALFSLGKFLIGLYLGKAGLDSAYGAAGSLVAFLIWVYYSAQIFFLGAEFTRAYSERHGSRARVRMERSHTAAPKPVPQ